MDKHTLFTGLTSQTLLLITGAVDSVELPAPEQVQTVGQIIIQLLIGVITVWKLIKKPKQPKS